MASTDGAQEVTKTVAEWNEERRKLGLKPLRIEEDGKAVDGTSDAPLDHWAEKAKKDAAKHDAVAAKQQDKRKRERAKLASGRGLGDILDDDDDLQAWASSHHTTSSRNLERAAAKNRATKQKEEAGDGPSLDNFRVTHDMADFQEGEQAILTLADERIVTLDGTLNSEMDLLEDINKTDAFKLKQREERKKQKANYDPSRGYHGDQQTGDILAKYDELPTRATGFTMADAHSAVAEQKLKEMALADQADGEISTLKFQSDVMDQAEEVKFRKKIAKQAKKQNKRKQLNIDEDEFDRPPVKMQKFRVRADVDSDEDDPELYEQLRRQKTAATTKRDLKKVQELLRPEEALVASSGLARDKDSRLVSATSEFCLTVQTHDQKEEKTKQETYAGMETFKKERENKLKLHDDEAANERRINDSRKHKSSSSSSAPVVSEQQQKAVEEQLHEKPLDNSMASALLYLRERDGFGKDQGSHLKRYTAEGGVLDIGTNEGDVKIEYKDEFGRVNTAKEAFRQLSWKFHGKKHGARNAERRLQRIEEENRIKRLDMNAPPSLEALKKVQKNEKTPWMTLG